MFDTQEIDKINFDEVFETSADSLRISNDEIWTFVKWEGDMPTSVQSLITKEGPYTHEQILELLDNSNWLKES
jgi:hypothetical protein